MWTFLKRHAARLVRREDESQSQYKGFREDGFATFKRDHPQATYAQFYVAQVMKSINTGRAHSTLGLKLYERQAGEGPDLDYFEVGRSPFQKYRKLCDIQPANRVVDYGCGSLRLGIHFIEFLDAGNYTGLDVTRDFMDIGIAAVPELIAKKRPHLDAIDPTSVRNAAAFGADVVISNAVSYHVHPDETDTYLGNLVAICSKPGARLIFDARLSDTPVRFRSRGWAYPLDLYIERLKPLTFVKQRRVTAVKEYADAPDLKSAVLEFRRS